MRGIIASATRPLVVRPSVGDRCETVIWRFPSLVRHRTLRNGMLALAMAIGVFALVLRDRGSVTVPRVVSQRPVMVSVKLVASDVPVVPVAVVSPRVVQKPADLKSLHAHWDNDRHCFYAKLALKILTQLVDECSRRDGHQSQRAADCGISKIEANQLKLGEVRNSMSDCGSDHDIIQRYFLETRDAARLGDQDAQLCYLTSFFSDGTADSESLYTDADRTEYQAVAPAYVDAAILRGDWRIVTLLSTNVQGFPPSGLSGYLPHSGEFDQAYKMKILLRLGAIEPYTKSLDRSISAETEEVEQGNVQGVTVASLGIAQASAQDMYIKYFSASSRLTGPAAPCDDNSRKEISLW